MMKDNRYFHNIALAVVLGLALAICMAIRTAAPMAVLPRLDIPNMVLISLAAMGLGHYCTGTAAAHSLLTIVGTALTFGLLPLAAGFASVQDVLKLAVAGVVVFEVTALLFDSIQDRLSSGPAAKAAPLLSAFGLYLAAQCFSGMIL